MSQKSSESTNCETAFLIIAEKWSLEHRWKKDNNKKKDKQTYRCQNVLTNSYVNQYIYTRKLLLESTQLIAT